MKKKYENYSFVLLGFGVFLFFVIFFLIYIVNRKIIRYQLFTGVVIEKDLVMTLSDSELKLFLKNKSLFINNKKMVFTIKKIEEVGKRKDDKYSRIFIETNISNLLEEGEIVEIAIMKESIKSYEIFRIIWEGDLNKKS